MSLTDQYFVVPEEEVTDTIFEAMRKNFSVDFLSLRRSDPTLITGYNPLIHKIKVILTYCWGTAPASLHNKGYGPYTNEELQADVLTDEEWGPPDDV